ncbi:unnamed protein product [Chrysodeixis includens]|uniref:Uncharacterized protein n=1 Tax=Chrysodeixis includens TaxID=689277 RepID=A0A9P0C524_CHRIL|nr:unnamed protein product [Chrysodeixis includens]
MVEKCVNLKDNDKILKYNILFIKSIQKYKKYSTMMKAVHPCSTGEIDNDTTPKKRTIRTVSKRAHSASPLAYRPKSPHHPKKAAERRCQSLSPCARKKASIEHMGPASASAPEAMLPPFTISGKSEPEKDMVMPQCVLAKVMRVLATKKREFLKMRKSLTLQQNTLLENYAQLKELESRAGLTNSDDSLGEVRILSVSGWPAHDLLLLIRDDLEMTLHSEISGMFGPHVLQQITSQLNPIPEEVLAMSAEIMARRIELLNLLRGKHRTDRATYLTVSNQRNLEWKTKNTEFDHETEKLHRLVAGTTENLKAKINYSLELAKIPWVDRETMMKKIERLQKENMILQHKLDEVSKKESPEDPKEVGQLSDALPNYQGVTEELSKERAAREALKEVVAAAESMLRVARARIATLERQLKDTRTELEAARKKHKDLEQLYRHRESSYDARSKKLIEVSKTGEITIETLSRQRDALELRVKELREQAEQAERAAVAKEAEQRARAESLQAKVAEQISAQEKIKAATEGRVMELDAKVKELEEQIQTLRERSVRLVDMERRRCLEYVPSKESEPSDRETEIWKELQVTRVALSHVEEELRQSRADKDTFLNSLSRIAQGEGTDSVQEKIATELLDREQKIVKLQHVIEEQRENEKLMEQSMTQYENQLAALRLEVKRLRNYDSYAKEVSYQELHTELLELHMQVETLSRERTALVTAAASRALMLERHERSADLFARMVRARRDLAALLDGRTEPPPLDDTAHAEVSRSLSSVCASAADTWTALRAERARVLRLESAVLAQSLQLEREGRVRTQLERRRAMLEREILRTQEGASDVTILNSNKNPSLIRTFLDLNDR